MVVARCLRWDGCGKSVGRRKPRAWADAVKDVRPRVGLDARSPSAWAAATVGEDVQDPLGARVGAAGVPCMPCGGSIRSHRDASHFSCGFFDTVPS